MCIMKHNLSEEGEQLRSLLEKELGVTMNYETGLNRLQLYDDEFENEITLLFGGQYYVAVERVILSKRRQGVFTKVFHWLVQYCQQHDIASVRIMGVLTREMQMWCAHWGMTPVEGASWVGDDGYVVGDYSCKAVNYRILG